MARLNEARRRAWGCLADELRGYATSAMRTLHELCVEAESEQARLGAARALLDYAAKTHELHTLGDQVAALEAKVHARPAGTPVV
jgi:hypothetical protein